MMLLHARLGQLVERQDAVVIQVDSIEGLGPGPLFARHMPVAVLIELLESLFNRPLLVAVPWLVWRRLSGGRFLSGRRRLGRRGCPWCLSVHGSAGKQRHQRHDARGSYSLHGSLRVQPPK